MRNQSKVPTYTAFFENCVADLSTLSSIINVVIQDPSIVSFDAITKSFKGLSQGGTSAVISYRGLIDTMYINVGSDLYTAGFPVTYSILNRWNLISLPLIVPDNHKSAVYPTAISNAFAYQDGYVTRDSLSKGVGYWLRFASAETTTILGYQSITDSITVRPGWNLIGSISTPVAVSAVTSYPPAIITSNFFGYSGSYRTSNTIEPGKAYWVKVSESGKLILSSSGVTSVSNRIRIIPTSEMPPSAPSDAYINQKTIPSRYALEQNYPNPFNPSTIIRYALPVEAKVTLKIYDLLGQEVSTLVDGSQEAGYHEIIWSRIRVGTGVYYYRLTAGPFVQTKKLLLLR